MKIQVPATSANLGPGFDSCGIAVSRYLTVEVGERTNTWQVAHDLGTDIPKDETNLLVQTALTLVPQLAPRQLTMTSTIPIARGLGSSSSVIVAGIELANQLGDLGLSKEKKLTIATEMEGHPDNVAPAIFGDFVVASYVDDEVTYVQHAFPTCDIVAFVPNHELLTKESRAALPPKLAYSDAVKASAIGNVMIAAVLTNDLPLAGKMMEKDLFHENFRQHLVPHLQKIRQISKRFGGHGCFLSGAGPTVLLLSPAEKTPDFVRALRAFDTEACVDVLQIDRLGTQIR